MTEGKQIGSNALAGYFKRAYDTLSNCVTTRTKFNPTQSKLPTNCSALTRLPAPLVLLYKREWDVCLSVHTFVVRGKLLV